MNPVRMGALAAALIVVLAAQGCVLTKIVTVPMRVGAAAVSIIPAVGNDAHDSIDDTAEIIDEIPL